MIYLHVLQSNQHLLKVRERSWLGSRKLWVVLCIPIAFVPLFYSISFAQEVNWIALFLLVNGVIQLVFFVTGMSYIIFIDTIWTFDKQTGLLTITKVRPSPCAGAFGCKTLGCYLPEPLEFRMEDIANVYMSERVDGKRISYAAAVEITGGATMVLAPYHPLSSAEQAAEKKVIEAIKSFLHLVQVDYSA